MKQYCVEYESDKRNPFSNHGEFNHTYGFASSIKTARQYISQCREKESRYNPRNFRIYDTYADVDADTDYVPCVYREA